MSEKIFDSINSGFSFIYCSERDVTCQGALSTIRENQFWMGTASIGDQGGFEWDTWSVAPGYIIIVVRCSDGRCVLFLFLIDFRAFTI